MAAGKGGDPPGQLDPETDAIDRFERMVETQIDTLEGIDDKAAHVTRFVALLLGVVFTGLSLVPRFGGATADLDSRVAVLTLFVGVIALVSSLGLAIVTFLSSVFEYGPDEELGNSLANYQITSQRYESILLRSYYSAIRKNKRVLRINARRFRNSLATLLVGVTSLTLSGTLLVMNLGLVVEIAVVLVASAIAGRLFTFVLAEDYLTLDYQITTNERD